MTKMTTYQFVGLQQAVYRLINDYKTVNDDRVLAVTRADVFDVLLGLLPAEDERVKTFLQALLQRDLTRQRAEKLFDTLTPFVEPFPTFSEKQLQKFLPKVKKLKQPAPLENPYTTSYLAWDDTGIQRTYLVVPTDKGYLGLMGDVEPQVVHGLCAICHEFGNVSLFTSTVKGNAQGNYTKKGNYICRDHEACNAQLATLDHLEKFVAHVRPQK